MSDESTLGPSLTGLETKGLIETRHIEWEDKDGTVTTETRYRRLPGVRFR
jgi:hypothetical protein